MKEKILNMVDYLEEKINLVDPNFFKENSLNNKIVEIHDLVIRRDKEYINKQYIQGRYIVE